MTPEPSSILLPTDPAERRRLWRDWIEHDVPGERMKIRRVMPTESAPAAEGSDAEGDWVNEAMPHPPAMIAGLRAAIDEATFDGQIAMSDRQRLTARAMRLGLTRFEASLLIASVLHRAPRSPRTPRQARYVRRVRWTIARMLVLAVVVEAVALAGAVAYFR